MKNSSAFSTITSCICNYRHQGKSAVKRASFSGGDSIFDSKERIALRSRSCTSKKKCDGRLKHFYTIGLGCSEWRWEYFTSSKRLSNSLSLSTKSRETFKEYKFYLERKRGTIIRYREPLEEGCNKKSLG